MSPLHSHEYTPTYSDTYTDICAYIHTSANHTSYRVFPLPLPKFLLFFQLSDQQNGWLCLAKTLTITRADSERTIQAYIGALSLPLPPSPPSSSSTSVLPSVLPLSLPFSSLLFKNDRSSYGMLHSAPLSALLQVAYFQSFVYK